MLGGPCALPLQSCVKGSGTGRGPLIMIHQTAVGTGPCMSCHPGGLHNAHIPAGIECPWQIARCGVPPVLRPV